MTNKIKILHLEDLESDADLIKRVLLKAHIEAEIMVVERREDYVQALIEFEPDVILSDHTLPSFNSIEALDIFKQTGLKIPFILVTATISEEYAVSVIKAGANDYILKQHLENLPGAIRTALEKIDLEITSENNKALVIKEKTNAVLVAHEKERNQMANESLENINQILAASNLYIDCAINEEDKSLHFMHTSKKYIQLAITEIQQLAQLIMPPTLGEIGLIESLENWLKAKSQPDTMNITTKWTSVSERLISDQLKLAIYRIVQEQIDNTIKYSNALNVYISLEQKDSTIALVIRDDGIGFDTTKAADGVGLLNIHTRAEIHGGKVLVHSEPQKGCLMVASFPV
ncbi:MAG: response regulator [Ferruginibacter sp.]